MQDHMICVRRANLSPCTSCRKIALVQATLEASSPADLRSEREDVTWRVISEAVTPHM